jgi:hypothetical protein
MAVSADLGEALEHFVTKLVATGRYHSSSSRPRLRPIWSRSRRILRSRVHGAPLSWSASCGIDAIHYWMRRAVTRWCRATNIWAFEGAFGRHLIFYRVGENIIEVIHILHGARDYEPLLFPEE